MTNKHLMYWVWKYLERHNKEKYIIMRAEEENWQFSDKSIDSQISVAKALEESYTEYKKVKT